MATQKCRMGGRDVARHRRSAAREERCAPHLVHGDVADLLAVGLARAGLHARRLLQQNCGTGHGARHEGRCRMSDFEGGMPWAGRDWPQQRAGPGELCAVSLAYGGRAAGAWSARTRRILPQQLFPSRALAPLGSSENSRAPLRLPAPQRLPSSPAVQCSPRRVSARAVRSIASMYESCEPGSPGVPVRRRRTRRRRRFEHKGEAAVLIHGDLHRNDHARLVLRN